MDQLPQIPVKSYAELRQEIRSGDILLCSGTSIFSNLIQQATQSVWSHVAFILRLDVIDRIMILESVESIGVRAVTLSSYVQDYDGTGKAYPGHLMIARHKHFNQDHISNLSKYAVDLLGHPYNKQEILRIAARISMNNTNVSPQLDTLKQPEFICSEYAYTCFQSVGIHINYDPKGFIAPADFARCPEVKPLAFIENSFVTQAHSNKTQIDAISA